MALSAFHWRADEICDPGSNGSDVVGFRGRRFACPRIGLPPWSPSFRLPLRGPSGVDRRCTQGRFSDLAPPKAGSGQAFYAWFILVPDPSSGQPVSTGFSR